MKLTDLLKGIEPEKIVGNAAVEINSVVMDSSFASKGSLFICLRGENADGTDFIPRAESYGAVAVLTERETDTPLVQIIVKNARTAMSVVAANFYGNPAEKLKLVGVVGTNGKTTVSRLIYEGYTYAGVKCGLIGTLGSFYDGITEEATLTTPDPLALNKTLSEMLLHGITTVVMEVSAHAAYYDKLYGIKFEAGVFTNFSQDHLDFFKTMEDYENAKLKFFSENDCKYIVTSADDETGLKIASLHPKAITYGIDNPSDVFAIEVKERAGGTSFVINLFDCVFNVKLKLIGRFNVYNALAAATALSLTGVAPKTAVEGLMKVKGIDGRLERVNCDEINVFVDYAHTPGGLSNVLKTLKNSYSGKLICVFGCGGNRDAKKRPLMGEISGKYADFTVITSDNPRFEDPMDIIREIEEGVLKVSKKYVIVEERAEGIRYALSFAKKGDVVLIAGKGAEKYQDILGIKTPYNDKDTAINILRESGR